MNELEGRFVGRKWKGKVLLSHVVGINDFLVNVIDDFDEGLHRPPRLRIIFFICFTITVGTSLEPLQREGIIRFEGSFVNLENAEGSACIKF